MTIRDDHGGAGEGASKSTATGRRRGGRRTTIAVGVASVAAVLGAGAYTVTDRLTDHGSATDISAPAPEQPVADTSSAQAPSGPLAVPSAAATAGSTAPTTAPDVVASIKAAREKAAKDGVKLTRPRPAKATQPIVGLARTTTGSLNAGGIVRLVSARSDLTGQQELGWVAGGITRHGKAQCTQTFQFHGGPPAKKANLLLCFRTSAKKSVAAIVVDPEGKPSATKAIKELDKKWRSMG